MIVTGTASHWVSAAKPLDSIRLICFPHAGGSTTCFRRWGLQLNPEIVVSPLHLPGRGIRYKERPETDIDGLVYKIARDIHPLLRCGGDFLLYGHSVGANVAFHLACELEQVYGLTAKGLIVAAVAPPSATPGSSLTSFTTDESLLSAIAALNGTPQEILWSQDAMELFLPIVKADLNLARSSKYTQFILQETAILALSGDADPTVSREEMQFWRRHTKRDFTGQSFQGGHFFVETAQEAVMRLFKDYILTCCFRSRMTFRPTRPAATST